MPSGLGNPGEAVGLLGAGFDRLAVDEPEQFFAQRFIGELSANKHLLVFRGIVGSEEDLLAVGGRDDREAVDGPAGRDGDGGIGVRGECWSGLPTWAAGVDGGDE